MEDLIHELNAPGNQGAPERINEIQKQIQLLQRQKSAWQLGLEFLQHKDSVVRFYGALTLTVKIRADWHTDDFEGDDSMKHYLLEALITNYVRLSLSSDAEFVLQKLCSTLAALYQRLGSNWQLPIRHVFTCLVNHNFIPHQSLPEVSQVLENTPELPTSQLLGALRLALTLIEDLGSAVGKDSSSPTTRVSDSCPDVLQLLSHCLNQNWGRYGLSDPSKDQINGSLHTHRETYPDSVVHVCLQTLPLWLAQLKPYALHALKTETEKTNSVALECIKAVLGYFEKDGTLSHTEDCLQCLLSIQQALPRMLAKADPQFPSSFADSPAVYKLFESLQAGDFSSDSVLLVDILEAIMAQVDLSTPEYILSGRYAKVLQMLLRLLTCDGTAMIEDTVCQIVLETIITIIEGYIDWEESEEALDYLMGFVRTACESCLAKIKFPQAEMVDATQSWDSDDRARFHDFRLDVQDFLQSAFTILGQPLLQAIVQSLARNTGEATWSDFESSLFCLLAFSDTINTELELYDSLVEATLTSPYFRMAIHSPNVPDKARNTSIKFLTEMTAYLQRSPDLMPILNFLFNSLHQPSLLSSASRAIYTLCDVQRSSLVQALPDFVNSLSTISDLRGVEKHRIYGGVAAVVQAVPIEIDKVQPLIKVLQSLSEHADENTVYEDGEPDPSQVTDRIQTLAAIGRGLRAPNDAPILIESVSSVERDFWISGPGCSLQQQVLTFYGHLVSQSHGKPDSELVEAMCDFIRSGFTEDHPSPLKFATETSTKLVTENIGLDSPNIDAVMACASSLLASSKIEDFQPHLAQLLHQVMASAQQFLEEAERTQSLSESSFPSASLDFVSRLLPEWTDSVLSTQDGKTFLQRFVQLALLVIADSDTLPRRSAASFFSALVDVCKPGKSLGGAARQNLATLMQHESPKILAILLRLVGGECARSELEVLTDPLKRYVLNFAMLFKSVCSEAVRDESRVLTDKALQETSFDQRLRFISQMEALRGGRKSNDVVKEFWIACRGSSFGYIA